MLLLISFHSVCLTSVSLSFHPRFFSHSSAYRGDRCALVLVMPARLRDAISGILAGGIPGFGTTTFLLGTSRSSLLCLAFSCCFNDDLLRTGHISCLVITFHRCYGYVIPLRDVLVLVVFLFVLFLCGFVAWLCWFGCCVFFSRCGMESYQPAPRTRKPSTASASLAVINTASKHLHNDLARAIKALAQKKSKVCMRCPLSALACPGIGIM